MPEDIASIACTRIDSGGQFNLNCGNESHILQDIGPGVQFTSTVQNDARRVDSSVSIGDELWVSWAPGNTLVLAE